MPDAVPRRGGRAHRPTPRAVLPQSDDFVRSSQRHSSTVADSDDEEPLDDDDDFLNIPYHGTQQAGFANAPKELSAAVDTIEAREMAEEGRAEDEAEQVAVPQVDLDNRPVTSMERDIYRNAWVADDKPGSIDDYVRHQRALVKIHEDGMLHVSRPLC